MLFAAAFSCAAFVTPDADTAMILSTGKSRYFPIN